MTSLVSWHLLMTPMWARWPHTRVTRLFGDANVMTQEIYCGHKNGEIGSGPTQSDLRLQSGASLGPGIQEVVSNKSGDHSHNIRYQHQLTLRHWQDRNTIDCLLYWVSITTDFKKRLWMYSCGDEPHFWRKYFSLEQRKCCLAEQNANSISVLRLDFLMCGEGRRVKPSQGDTEHWHSPGQREPGSGETEQPRDKGIQTLLPLSNSRFHSQPKLGVSRCFFILVSLIRVNYCSSKNKRNYPWREERWWLLISNQVLINVVDSGRVKKHVFW